MYSIQKSTHCIVFRIKIVAFDAFLQGKTWYLLSHIGTYSVIPTSYVWDKSLQDLCCCGFHLHLESNEIYSYFLVFVFLTNVTVYLAYSWQNGNILLSLGSKSNTLLHLYKQFFFIEIRNKTYVYVIISVLEMKWCKECKSVKEFIKKNVLTYVWDNKVLRMGHFKLNLMSC